MDKLSKDLIEKKVKQIEELHERLQRQYSLTGQELFRLEGEHRALQKLLGVIKDADIPVPST